VRRSCFDRSRAACPRPRPAAHLTPKRQASDTPCQHAPGRSARSALALQLGGVLAWHRHVAHAARTADARKVRRARHRFQHQAEASPPRTRLCRLKLDSVVGAINARFRCGALHARRVTACRGDRGGCVLQLLPLLPPHGQLRSAAPRTRHARDVRLPRGACKTLLVCARAAGSLWWPRAHASAAAFQTEFDTTARQRRSSGTAQNARVVRTCKRVHCSASWKWQQCFHCVAARKCYLAH
jgi:hypothetical protein